MNELFIWLVSLGLVVNQKSSQKTENYNACEEGMRAIIDINRLGNIFMLFLLALMIGGVIYLILK